RTSSQYWKPREGRVPSAEASARIGARQPGTAPKKVTAGLDWSASLMAECLLSQTGRGAAAAEPDCAGVVGCFVERADHARRAAAAETDPTRVGDFLGGFANDRLLLAGHGVSPQVFDRAAKQRAGHWRKKPPPSSNW